MIYTVESLHCIPMAEKGTEPDKRAGEILDAAVALADERGLDAVSMRSVAQRVGVTPMALYPHVGSKTALLDGMVGRLLGGMMPSGEDGPGELTWQERLGAIARAARAVTLAHPWAAVLIFSRPAVTDESVRTVDLIYGALLEAGVAEADVPRLERMLSTVIIGFAASEAGGRFGHKDDADEVRQRRARRELPASTRLAGVLSAPLDWDAEFEADIEDLRLLVEAVARRGRSAPAG